jgi:type II secretory pathway predicted ATPase ExeA
MLMSPTLHQFAQRISSDFHLSPLDTKEVAKYITFRLEAVGSKEPLFTEEACALVARATGGVPRMINVLCDTALVYGFAGDSRVVGQEIVRQVIADKQQHSMFPFKSLSESR